MQRNKAVCPDDTRERQRLEALHGYAVLDTAPEEVFEEMAHLAAAIVDAPIALICLIDEDRLWAKAQIGWSANEIQREDSPCAHVAETGELLVVSDMACDARFARHPITGAPFNVRFYVGAPLINSEGFVIGTVCVMDHVSRNPTAAQQRALSLLSRQVMGQLEARRRMARLTKVRTERAQDIRQLRRALDESQFELHYQPKVDLRDARLRGLEALIRWRHPERGLLGPAHFIDVLEESGLILEAGRWVVQEAVRQHRKWTQQGLRPPRIAVNVSPVQLRHPDFVAELHDALRGGAATPGSIDIEITEGVFMESLTDSVQKLYAIRQLGVQVAVDDFGTGYSSLAYLARLPIDFLKVDRCFVSVMAENPNDMAIVSSIISLAHGLNFKVIAEGVETIDQRKLLQLLRCDQMQGHLFSAAVSATEIEDLLSAQEAFATSKMPILDDEPPPALPERLFVERRLVRSK